MNPGTNSFSSDSGVTLIFDRDQTNRVPVAYQSSLD